MKSLSFLSESIPLSCAALHISKLDLSSAVSVELCKRDGGYSLGVYFKSYNKYSLDLFNKILSLSGASKTLCNTALSWFVASSSETGINIDNGVLKVYKSLLSESYVATGADYSLNTGDLLRTKTYRQNKCLNGFDVESIDCNGIVEIGTTLASRTSENLIEEFNIIRSHKFNILMCYKRDNGQEYILIEI